MLCGCSENGFFFLVLGSVGPGVFTLVPERLSALFLCTVQNSLLFVYVRGFYICRPLRIAGWCDALSAAITPPGTIDWLTC